MPTGAAAQATRTHDIDIIAERGQHLWHFFWRVLEVIVESYYDWLLSSANACK